jgi:WD40 repeat protein
MEQRMEPLSREQQLNEALAAFYQEAEAGAPPDLQAFLARYPDLAEELGSFFGAKQAFENEAGPLLPSVPLDRSVFPRFGSYELHGEVARGGMGVVYRAWQTSLNRVVALKMILGGPQASPNEVRRFHDEAQAAAALDHPHIVPIYEVGCHDGLPYYSMKLVEGGCLAEHIAEFVDDPQASARLLATVARAVHYAHQRGILHRDLKPANILLSRSAGGLPVGTAERSPQASRLCYEPHVTDFGLAKRLAIPVGNETAPYLTPSHAIVGTPAYMAPEQAAGQTERLTIATDVYSLGAILYELLTGRPPFRASTLLKTLQRVVERDPRLPHLVRPGVDRNLETVCLKCLKKTPETRYGSALELAEDLERWLAGEPVLARPAGTWERGLKWARRRPAVAGLLSAVLLVAATGLGMVLWQWQRAEGEHRKAVERANAEAESRHNVEEALNAAERNLYYHQIALADRYFLEANITRAEQYLDACPERLRHWEWHYLKRLCHQETLKLAGGWHAVFSPDGRSVATAEGLRVRMHDAMTGKVLCTWQLENRSEVRSLAFRPDGRTLAVAGNRCQARTGVAALVADVDYQGFVTLYDLADGKEPCSWRIPLGGKMPYDYRLTYSPDGNRLAVATCWAGSSGVSGVWIYDDAGKVLRHFPHAGFHATFSPDGKRLAFTAQAQPGLHAGVLYDNVLRVWDLEADRAAYTIHEDLPPCTGPHYFSRDGKLLFSRHAEDVFVRDATTGREHRRLSGIGGNDMALSPDGRLLALCWGSTIQVRDAATGVLRTSFPGHKFSAIRVVFSPDGTRLASVGIMDAVRIWEVEHMAEGFRLPGTPRETLVQALSPDGSTLATKRAGFLGLQTIEVADAHTGKVRLRLPSELPGWSGSQQDQIDSQYSPLLFSPDGGRIASISNSRTLRLWDVTTGRRVAECQGHSELVVDLAFSPDARQIASASRDKSVRLWDTASGLELAHYDSHAMSLGGVAFSPDGRRIAWTGQSDQLVQTGDQWLAPGMVRIQDLTSEGVRELREETGRFQGLAFSRDGGRLAAAWGGTARIWNVRTCEPLLTLAGDPFPVMQVAFSPDGKRLVTQGMQGLKLWDACTGQEVLTLRGRINSGLGAGRLTFSADGHRLYVSGQGGLQCWDATPAAGP